jgi:hypothetical protein
MWFAQYQVARFNLHDLRRIVRQDFPSSMTNRASVSPSRGLETMITNETEIRIALQAILVSVLALNGYWGCAVVVLFILLPWKPIFAVAGYLAQPVVDWRVQRARDRRGKGLAEMEKELDMLLRAPAGSVAHSAGKTPETKKFPPSTSSRPMETLKASSPTGFVMQPLPATAETLAATMAIRPVIKEHVRTLPQGVFNNMDLEVEQVKFNGETAEAYVRFQSPNVSELVIRQRYALRKSGNQWLVESRQPANGGSKPLSQDWTPSGAPMRFV